jgi:uncharacterized membrane protein
MRPGPPSTLLLVLALLLAFAGPPGVAAGAEAAAPATPGASDASSLSESTGTSGTSDVFDAPGVAETAVANRLAVQSGGFDPNVTVLRVEIDTDGDARWTVVHAFNLTDENDTRAFERLAAEFERGEVGGSYPATMERAAVAASEATGREMSIRDVSREATVDDGTGRLVTRLTWTSFARVSGDSIRVNDAFALASGSWLPGLAADERLVVGPPPGYRIDSAPSADSFRNGSLVWEGPTEFGDGYLSLTYRKVTPPPGPPNTTGTESPSPAGPFEGRLLPIVVGAFGLGLLLVAAYLVFRREAPIGPIAEPNGGTDTDDDGSSATELGGTEGPTEPTGPGDGAPAESGVEAEDEEDDGADEEPAVDPELLSDEERVEHLLRRNGGRMKQANIVKETNWSNAKVSQLLSSMDEAGRVDKLRIGRENLITLPDEEPGDFGE